ncbi:MAG: methylthioribulose 1-phosphate dehydratase [Woeseia sp.]
MPRSSVPQPHTELAEALCRVCHLFGERQWCLATSGNFSARADESQILITRSGTDKSRLSTADLMLCTLDGEPVDLEQKPSAETALHTCLYRQDPDIGAVLHTHSVASTVLSRALPADLVITGFEMQKAIDGIRSHDESLTIPVFDNSQDMKELAAALKKRLEGGSPAPGFLIRGHGLYGWGSDIAEAQRHVEGFEFLLACLWQERGATR